MNTTEFASGSSNNDTSRALPLSGKVALVTGGSRGIGAAIVRRLVRDGARVAFTYAGSTETAEALARELSPGDRGEPRALAIKADNRDVAAVRASVERAASAFGRLDILVNNAAVVRAGELSALSLEDIDELLAVNVRGPVVATREALRYLGQGGRIVNIGSVNADRNPMPGLSIYALTKGALASFTRGLTRELGARGITINEVQPGPVDTDMNPKDGAFASALTPLIAVGRYGRADEVAAFVAHLVGPDGGYISGARLAIDGGFSV